MVETKVVEKIKTHILCSVTFSRKSCRLWDNVEKCGGAREVSDDDLIRRMYFACWITKAIEPHSEHAILLFLGNSGYVNAPHCYVIWTLAALLTIVLHVPYTEGTATPCWHVVPTAVDGFGVSIWIPVVYFIKSVETYLFFAIKKRRDRWRRSEIVLP